MGMEIQIIRSSGGWRFRMKSLSWEWRFRAVHMHISKKKKINIFEPKIWRFGGPFLQPLMCTSTVFLKCMFRTKLNSLTMY